MNALGSSVMGDDDVPHGTQEGWHAGCRGSSCPSAAQGLSCTTAHRRYAGDYGFRKMVDAGLSPAQIVASEAGIAVREPKPVKRQKRAQDLGRLHVGERGRAVQPSALTEREVSEAEVRDVFDRGLQAVSNLPTVTAPIGADGYSFVSLPVLAPAEGLPGVVSLQVPEVWRVSEGPAFEVAEKVHPESVATGVVGTAVPTDSPIRPEVSPRPFRGRTEAHSDEIALREAAALLAVLGVRRQRAWQEIEEVREPSNVLILRLVGLGMPQHEVAELAGISQASVNALVKTSRTKGGQK